MFYNYVIIQSIVVCGDQVSNEFIACGMGCGDVEHGRILFSIDMICHGSFIEFSLIPRFKN